MNMKSDKNNPRNHEDLRLFSLKKQLRNKGDRKNFKEHYTQSNEREYFRLKRNADQYR